LVRSDQAKEGTSVTQEGTQALAVPEASEWIAELLSDPPLQWEDFPNDPKVRRRVGELLIAAKAPKPRTRSRSRK
jgi:hypothetical protein